MATRTSISAGSASAAGPSAARSRRWPYSAGPTSSTPRWPGPPITDQRLHTAHWRERFLGHPEEFPERYDACDLVREAPRLTRPLLLVHGLADDNVHPANTLRLSSALLAAGRPHEVLLLPGAGHQAIGRTPLTENLLWHQVRFLRRHLCPGSVRGR